MPAQLLDQLVALQRVRADQQYRGGTRVLGHDPKLTPPYGRRALDEAFGRRVCETCAKPPRMGTIPVHANKAHVGAS